MKLFIKLMILVVVAAVAAPFFLKGPDGRPLLSWDRLHAPEVRLPDLGKAADTMKESLRAEEEAHAKPVEVFKWQDEEGGWHYSDNNEQGRQAQKLTVDPNANLSHFEPAKASEHKEQAASARENSDPSPSITFPASISLGKIPTLIDDARNVDKLQKERLERQERALQD